MMYDDLIVQIRQLQHWFKPNGSDQFDPYEILEQAANAIEELQKDVMRLEDESGLYDELPTFYIYPTKWIPVTERLPKDGEFVLVCNDDKHMMIAKYETETYEWYHKYTNYDFDIWDNEEQGPVCYWMPLPEPPKEDE